MKPVLKKIYNAIPLKRELYSVIKTVWTPPEYIYKHLHFRSSFTVKINDSKRFKLYHNNSWIENEIFWNGLGKSWEKVSIQLWMKLCENSSIIFDIGANTGIYSLVAKAINPKAKVYAFEPLLIFYDILQKNNSLNHYDILSYPLAISNNTGEVIIDDYSAKQKTIKTKCITLDLIKIDVEKHEPEVLQGFKNYLPLFKPTFLIEILNDDIGKKVFDFVNGLGYLYFSIDDIKGTIHQTETITRSKHWNYLFCNPEIASKLGLI